MLKATATVANNSSRHKTAATTIYWMLALAAAIKQQQKLAHAKEYVAVVLWKNEGLFVTNGGEVGYKIKKCDLSSHKFFLFLEYKLF